MIFCLSKSSNGYQEHEIHISGPAACPRTPDFDKQINLGDFQNCSDAMKLARKKFPDLRINGCFHCVLDCYDPFLTS